MTMTIEQAIERSISQTEIVHVAVPLTAQDMWDVFDGTEYDYDYCEVLPRHYEVWDCGETWRVHVILGD